MDGHRTAFNPSRRDLDAWRNLGNDGAVLADEGTSRPAWPRTESGPVTRMPHLSRRHLIRLYPRAWRRRYGQEFVLLLEASPLSVRSVANVCAAAGREWLLRTLTGRLLMGPVIAYAALLIAQALSTTVAADPTFSYEGGVRLVSPPWPVGLGMLQALMGFAVLARFGAGVTRRLPMRAGELAAWVLALTTASACCSGAG